MGTTILLADDHAIVLEGLRSFLRGQAGLKVVGDAADGREAARMAFALQPNVVVMDISMPGLNGIEATQRIREESPAVKVLILSMHSTPEHVTRALEAGARGFLLKQSVGAELLEAIRTVRDGRIYLSPAISDSMLADRFGHDGSTWTAQPLASLSLREREVLQLVVEEKSSAEIARLISLSPKTVETYRSRIMGKLKVESVVGLVKFAIRHGITPPE